VEAGEGGRGGPCVAVGNVGQLEAAPSRRGCCTNRGEWSGTADAVRERRTGGAGWQRGLVVSGGVRERVRESRAAR
jgi:hypothetical protein